MKVGIVSNLTMSYSMALFTINFTTELMDLKTEVNWMTYTYPSPQYL